MQYNLKLFNQQTPTMSANSGSASADTG